MTKIIMVLMLFGTHVEGHSQSTVGVIQPFTTMKACKDKRQSYLSDTKKALDSISWIMDEGKVKIHTFNVRCISYREISA